MSTARQGYTNRSVELDPKDYTVAWIAPLEIEARAALHLLDQHHNGRFRVGRGDEYVYHAGSMCGYNVIIATLPAGQEYGTGSAAALASQVKKSFPNLWFGLLVGVAAGLPTPGRDIRLGDVLVALSDGNSAGLVAYGLGKETEDGFQLLRHGQALATTDKLVRSVIGYIKLKAPNDVELFLPHYKTICNEMHADGTFADPGQNRDVLYLVRNGGEEVVERVERPASRRTRVWYGPLGSGDKLLKNAHMRDELRDKYGIIGLEMEAAGIMNCIPVGVIRGVCDYGDRHKNKVWQPYAAAMAASYAKALLDQIPPPNGSDREDAPRLHTEHYANAVYCNTCRLYGHDDDDVHCYKCREKGYHVYGHYSSDLHCYRCDRKGYYSYGHYSNDDHCFKCEEFGHWVKDCPQR